jgi:hypothetical protein
MRVAFWECRACRLRIDGGSRGVLLPVSHNCPALAGCIHRGELIEHVECQTCGSRGVVVAVFSCDVHGRCHLHRGADSKIGMDCRICEAAGEGFEAPTAHPEI